MTTTTTMWQGRLEGRTDSLFSDINDSLKIDVRLVREDIEGSIAWTRALQEADVLSHDESDTIVATLKEIAEQAAGDPQHILGSKLEDIHTWVEHQLTERLGDLGKKLHTGRSRNDQVATDLRLWTIAAIAERRSELRALQQSLVELGKRETGTVLPGYTHLQRAQPILFAHWCLAYYDMLDRDDGRFSDAAKRMSKCPLGSGALSGSAYPIDRITLARKLGFDGPTTNSLDAVSDRDFVVESLSAIALCAVHLSRLAEDLIFYASAEANFIELGDSVTSGSSMMPQKKNPDALELIRGKTGGAIGALVSLCVTLKGLPLSYNKDLQEDKHTLFDAMDNLSLSLRIASRVIETITVNREAALSAAQGAYSNATELADYLTERGVPFREAHGLTGRIVRAAIDSGLPLEEMPLEQMNAVAPQVQQDVRVHLTIDSALKKRDVLGGTAPTQVQAMLEKRSRSGSKAQPIDLNGAASKAGDIQVGPACVEHLDAVCQLVEYWAQAGENLPRSRDEILHSLNDFGVAIYNGEVVGCGSLYLYSRSLAEVRSLGVDPNHQGLGVGSRLLEYLLTVAQRTHIPRVFALTRAPEFFKRSGFEHVPIDVLPEKVFKDCLQCAKRSQCDEVAMIREFSAFS